MGTASFCGGVHHKRYSGQQEIAPYFYYLILSLTKLKHKKTDNHLSVFLCFDEKKLSF